MKVGMDVPAAVELYAVHLTMRESIQSGQTVASYCSAVVKMLKDEGIVHDPKAEVYTPRVSNIIAGFSRICEAKKPEKRFCVRICYCFAQYMWVINRIRQKFNNQPAFMCELLGFAAFHWAAAPRIGEMLHAPITAAMASRLQDLGRLLDLERPKGIMTANVAFIYDGGKPPVPSGHHPPAGAIGVAFFALGKKNEVGILGCRGYPAVPAGVDQKYCPVALFNAAVTRFAPEQAGYLFDAWPTKRFLIRDLTSVMKEVAFAHGLDPNRFTPHCSRIGAIKHLQKHGISGHLQALHLGHGSEASKAAYDHSGFDDLLLLQPALFDPTVGNVDELRFVYMSDKRPFFVQEVPHADE